MKNQKHRLLKLTVLAGSTAAAIHVVNKYITSSAVLKNLLNCNTPESNLYSWKFGDIYYTKQGEGSPLLLIHDLTASSSSEEWQSLKTQLAQKHTVYCLDLLGCGRSQKPAITYTNYLYVQFLTDFTKNVIKERTDVIATGLSSSFAIMSCVNDESIFGKLMLINPSDLSVLNQIPDRKSKAAKFLLELPLIGTLLYNILNSKSSIELFFTEKAYYNPFHVNGTVLDSYYESSHLNKGQGKYLQASIAGKYIYNNIAHGLKKINNSIFIVGGRKEPGIDASLALYRSLNPSIETEILDQAKHLPQLECPERISALADIFF